MTGPTLTPQSSSVQEEWRKVVGWEDLYEVSSLGRIRSLDRVAQQRNRQGPFLRKHLGKLLKCYVDKKGYLRVGLSKAGRCSSRLLHQLVCEAFHGPRQDGYEVAHQDGNRLNPAAENLRWATHIENMSDRVAHGTILSGERHGSSKLTDQQIAEIRASSEMGITLAAQYGVSKATITRLRPTRFC